MMEVQNIDEVERTTLESQDDEGTNWLLCGEDELTLRYRLARQAQRAWAKVPVEERASKLNRVGDALVERMDELAALVTEENGKRPVESIGHEVGAALSNVRWLCEKAWRALEPAGVSMPWMPHRRARVQHEAWGVVLVISPWNFPLSIPLGQVVAGLLAGNAVILKPSEVTPRVGAVIEDLMDTCGLPPNLFCVMQGDGSVGAKLLEARPDKVFFTGSLATGQKVMQAASRYPIPVCMELGGIDALIVLEDADLDYASSAAVWGGFFNGGQVCASVERLLVHESVRENFLRRVVDKARSLEPTVDLGRITASKQRAIYERHIEDARARGLDIHCGGDYIGPETLAPTIIDVASGREALIYREESFGPLMAVRSFRADADAARIHNELWGGLTASIFTGSSKRAEALAQQLDAGLVAINDVAATLHAVPELPWGGVGSSGFGRSHGIEGLLEFTWTKVLDTPRVGRHFKRPWWFPYGGPQAEMISAYTRLVGARGLRPRVRAAVDLGRSAVHLMGRHPRL
jgi:succinate-semialdehyde dehydrogenase/glutarate-semialdehyde dehydrogenase